MLLALLYIIETLEVIANRLHLNKYPTWEQWDPDSRARANSLLSVMGSFEFVVVLTIIVKVLDSLKGPTKKIQGRALDLYDVVGQVQLARTDLMFERDNDDLAFFKRCFTYAKDFAALFGEEVCSVLLLVNATRLMQKHKHHWSTGLAMHTYHFLTTSLE